MYLWQSLKFSILWFKGSHGVKLLQQVSALRDAFLHAISLDLHNSYNALYRFRCLGIVEGCGMEPRALCLLRSYWVRLNMVAWVGGYYGATFLRDRGVTQGDPLLPTISICWYTRRFSTGNPCWWWNGMGETSAVMKETGHRWQGEQSWTETTLENGQRRYTND